MNVTFIANACAIFEAEGFRLLSDPWLVDGVFDGSWCHAPDLKTRPADLQGVDALYISHIHPDHLDPPTLKELSRDLPVVCLDREGNFLARILGQLGFRNLMLIREGAEAKLGPFRLSLYGPFSRNLFTETSVGNLIDSALVIDDGKSRVLNANDNNPTVDAAKRLRESHRSLSMALLPYGSAGPYPSCFPGLSAEQKKAEAERIIQRNLRHLAAVATELGSDWILPFAGAYALGGRLWKKNSQLANPSWDEAADFLARELPEQKVVLLHEGLTFDAERGEIINGEYEPIREDERNAYIAEALSRRRFPYEDDPPVHGEELLADLIKARAHLWRFQDRFSFRQRLNIYISTDESGCFHFPLDSPDARWLRGYERVEPWLEARMDVRLLRRILDRRSNWNNAEIGCHIEFLRQPDQWAPDAHTMMSFFHC